MAQSIKLKNNTFIDSTGIVHNRKLLSEILSKIGLMAYPVGSLYISTNNTNPSTLFGGEWEQLNGYYLYLGNGYNKTSYTGKNTRGHKLTANQSGLRSHDHNLNTSTTAGNNSLNDKVRSADGGSAWNWNGHQEKAVQPEGGWDAVDEHSHNIATVECFAWRRTA